MNKAVSIFRAASSFRSRSAKDRACSNDNAPAYPPLLSKHKMGRNLLLPDLNKGEQWYMKLRFGVFMVVKM
jgi:hypothetical protein